MTEMSEKMIKKLSDGRQFRNISEFQALERDENTDEMIVEGHFTTFNEEYMLYRFGTYEVWEKVDPHAFDECDLSDVIMQFDHEGRVFARTRNHTLRITFDEVGGFMRGDVSKASGGEGLYNDIRNGLIDRMSFAFTVAEDKVEEIRNHDTGITKILRTIIKIGKLYDVSAVSIPANDGTDISARSWGDGVIERLEAERLEARRKEEARKRLALRLRIMSNSEVKE